MTARKLFALLLSLLLLLCPLLASCSSTQSTEDTSSTAGTASDGTESTGEGGGEKSKYLDENGMYRDAVDQAPVVYDHVPRGLFSILLRLGYQGKYRLVVPFR